jgi:hypothetical protein
MPLNRLLDPWSLGTLASMPLRLMTLVACLHARSLALMTLDCTLGFVVVP